MSYQQPPQQPDPDQWNPSIQKPPPTPTPQSFWLRKVGCMPMWLLLVIISAFSLYVLISIISAFSTGDNRIGNGLPPTPSASATPTPTDTPILTQAPTAKPRPKTMDQQLNDIVQHAGLLGNVSSPYGAKYNASDKSVTLGDYIGQGNLTNGMTVQEIKLECFTAQKAIWTSGVAAHISDVLMGVSMDVVDQYGKQSIQVVATCDLSKDTAQKFVWENLTDDSAWGDYDNTFIAPFLTQ